MSRAGKIRVAHGTLPPVPFLQALAPGLTGRDLAVAAVVAILAALLTPGVAAQISPGPLSRAHHELDGPAGCVRCHTVSPGAPEFRCLECHTEIASRLREKKGLHPVYAAEKGGGWNTSCVKCHSEHNGNNFAVVHWDPAPGKFDHSRSGFTLDGKHAGLACAKCHNEQRVSPVERPFLKVRDLNRTYLGLSTSCSSCHEDKHRGELGNNCAQCHNATDWKTARTFDHSRTKFALTGAHIQVACQKCHTPAASGEMVKFAGLKFQQCSSCHSDPHKGTFQQGCDSCHSTSTWKQTPFMRTFDHSRAKFALLGKHADVRCGSCHQRGDFKTPIAFAACADCHKPDPHNGQFAKRADGGKCESCHTVDGFKQAKFVLADHNKTGFPLREKHAAVECAKCHIPAGKATVFKVKFAACLDCHKDVHRGQFARAAYGNKCESCHDEKGFRPALFTVARHEKTNFALTGGHKAVACMDCHKPIEEKGPAQYHFDKMTCTTCHSDPHNNQFATRMQRVIAGGGTAGCEACHTTRAWRDVSRFDHDGTEFKLIGTHRAVECGGCHRPPNLERNLLHVNFKKAPHQCEQCHEDAHGGQFARAGVTRCAECHNSLKWRPSLFDHEKTAFALKGAHANVPCRDCHSGFKLVSEKKVLFYKPTPTACAACHGNKTLAGGL